jgi:hypothetical protein
MPLDLWLAIAGIVLLLVFISWISRKAAKRMDETADFDHKTGVGRFMG